MKLENEKIDVQKSQEFKTVNYGLNAENAPLLFKLLRSNLYSDRHGSIIRELVSNVIDSHTEAGKPDIMGEVEWIPSSRILGVDCQLIIRDFGVGLSHERMTEVFCNYLSSTKRGGNTEIGGFGLGSKAPFSYTDSFTVQTIYNGVLYRYLCYIDETDLGAISLLEQKETDRGNGTEIIIPIKDEVNDYKLFQAAILKQLAYFTTIKYKGFQTPDPVITFENDYCIIKESPPMADLHIVLGNVAYEVDFTALGGVQPGWQGSGVGLKFNIGEIQPVMSRESIHWSQGTKEKVLKKIEQAKKSIRKQIQIELNHEKDYAKWYGYVQAGKSLSFPGQFDFADIKRTSEYAAEDGTVLTCMPNAGDWFAGHNIRSVTKGGWVRGAVRDYSTDTPTSEQLQRLPAFKLARNLSAETCLYLFTTYSQGFLAISHVNPPDEDLELDNYYEQTKLWAQNLPDFDAVDVPEGSPTGYTEERLRKYRELVKNRKLEGKFTSKRLIENYRNPGASLDSKFIYEMCHGKFEELKGATVIYGYQEDHSKLCKIAAMLTLSGNTYSKFKSQYNYKEDKPCDRPLYILKIGRHFEKQFFALPNSWHVDDIFALEGKLKETLASIATAIRIKPYIHQYHVLNYFGKINNSMELVYKDIHKFVEEYDESRTWAYQVEEEILNLCKDNLNQEYEERWQVIKDYLDRVGMLKCPNFAMYSKEHIYGKNEGTTGSYLKRWVSEQEPFIKEYLLSHNRHVDTAYLAGVIPHPENPTPKEVVEAAEKLEEELEFEIVES